MYEIKLSGPGKNSLSTEMLRFIQGELEAAGGQPVLLTGEGDAFSAGLNLKEVAGYGTAEAMRPYLELLDDACAALYDYPGPVVGAINGHAIAGGCVVALCCDIRVAAEHPRLRIGLNEVALGVSFPPKIMAIVSSRLSEPARTEVLLSAGLFGVEDALRLGLVDALSEDPVAEGRRRLAKLERHGQASYTATKADLRRGVTDVDPEISRHFYEDLLPMWVSEEVKARIAGALRR